MTAQSLTELFDKGVILHLKRNGNLRYKLPANDDGELFETIRDNASAIKSLICEPDNLWDMWALRQMRKRFTGCDHAEMVLRVDALMAQYRERCSTWPSDALDRWLGELQKVCQEFDNEVKQMEGKELYEHIRGVATPPVKRPSLAAVMA